MVCPQYRGKIIFPQTLVDRKEKLTNSADKCRIAFAGDKGHRWLGTGQEPYIYIKEIGGRGGESTLNLC